MPTKLLLLALLSALPGRARAEVVGLETLERLALEDRHALAAQAARLRAADAQIDLAQSAARPRIGLEARAGASPGRELIDVRDEGSGETYKVSGARALDQDDAFLPELRYGVELELRQNIYDFGRSAASVEAARAQRASAEAEAEASTQQIIQEVRVRYLGWLSRAELQAIAARTASDASSRRERVETLIAEGARPAAELSPARADELLAQLELERARGELADAQLLLEQAVGTPLPPQAEPDRTLLDARDGSAHDAHDAHDASAASAGRGALAARAPVGPLRALELQRDAANAQARALDKADSPSLAGSASAGVYAQGATPFPSYGVGVSLSVPLWDGGSSSANAAAARARAQALDATIADQSQVLDDARARAALAQQNASARLAAARALLQISQTRLQESEQAYELGAGGVEEIGRARAMLRRAETEVVLARVARASAALQQDGP